MVGELILLSRVNLDHGQGGSMDQLIKVINGQLVRPKDDTG